MLMRTDPFRELDRLTQQVFGTAARPAAMPMDAYRQGDSFYVHLDLPGIKPESIELTVEQNVLTVRAERAPVKADGAEMIVPAALRHLHPAGLPRRDPRRRQDRRRLRGGRADPDHPGPRGSQAPQHPGHKQRPETGRHRVMPGPPHPGLGRRPPAAQAARIPGTIRATR